MQASCPGSVDHDHRRTTTGGYAPALHTIFEALPASPEAGLCPHMCPRPGLRPDPRPRSAERQAAVAKIAAATRAMDEANALLSAIVDSPPTAQRWSWSTRPRQWSATVVRIASNVMQLASRPAAAWQALPTSPGQFRSSTDSHDALLRGAEVRVLLRRRKMMEARYKATLAILALRPATLPRGAAAAAADDDDDDDDAVITARKGSHLTDLVERACHLAEVLADIDDRLFQLQRDNIVLN